MTQDYRSDHNARYAKDKVTEAGKNLGVTNHEYSNGRKTSKHDREYWNWLNKVEAEAQRDKR